MDITNLRSGPILAVLIHFLLRSSAALPDRMLLGSFGNDDGDDKEDVKKAIGLDWQNNNFARASCFFVHFFTFLARLRRENA